MDKFEANETFDDADTYASSTLELDLTKIRPKEEHVPVPLKIPLILRNRIKVHEWKRIRQFCKRYDTKCAILGVFDRCIPCCCCCNPIIFTFIIGCMYAFVMAMFSAWYVDTKCIADDDDSVLLLCGPWKFVIIPAYVVLPALAPTFYLTLMALREYQDLEVLPQLLFRSLYGYPGMSVHFIHCANAEAFRNTLRFLVRKSNEMEKGLNGRCNLNRGGYSHSKYCSADFSLNDDSESPNAEDILTTVCLEGVGSRNRDGDEIVMFDA